MPELDNQAADDKVVEIDGKKYLEDPENPGKALNGEDGKPVPFEEASEEEEEPEETDEEKQARETKEAADKAAAEAEAAAEPPVRKSAKDFIIERKNKKIKKLETGEDFEDEEEEDEELTPGGKKAISKAIEEQVGPIAKKLKTDTDEAELQAVLSDPKYGTVAKSMEKTIRKYMDHPSYAGVPVEYIFLGLAAKKMGIAIPDTKTEKQIADEKANASRIAGGGRRKKDSLGKIPDVSQMTDKEVEALATQVKIGQYNQE